MSAPTSMQEIMDEEFARQLAAEEAFPTLGGAGSDAAEATAEVDDDAAAAVAAAEAADAEAAAAAEQADFELARRLQEQEDCRHARATAAGSGRGDWVSNPYMATRPVLQFEYDERHAVTGDDEDEDGSGGHRDGDYADDYTEEGDMIFLGGGLFERADGQLVSKHDAKLCGRRNVRGLDRRIRTAGTGKAIGQNVTVGNQAFNSLKRFLDKRQRKGVSRHGRVSKAEFASKEGVMDDKTRLLLFKLINNGHLKQVYGAVKTGKEGHVYYAKGWKPKPEGSSGDMASTKTYGAPCKHVAVKIFRTTLNEFTNRGDYMNGDHRFRHTKLARQNPRTVVVMWAEKEMYNLIRLERAGVPCPRPLFQREHMVFMSFIGTKGWPAPTLKEAALPDDESWTDCYRQVVTSMHRMYHGAKLVHADLSEYNILYHKGTCVIIDVGQSVHVSHPRAGKFLLADCKHVTDFFARKGVHVLTAEALLALVMDSDATGGVPTAVADDDDDDDAEVEVGAGAGAEDTGAAGGAGGAGAGEGAGPEESTTEEEAARGRARAPLTSKEYEALLAARLASLLEEHAMSLADDGDEAGDGDDDEGEVAGVETGAEESKGMDATLASHAAEAEAAAVAEAVAAVEAAEAAAVEAGLRTDCCGRSCSG